MSTTVLIGQGALALHCLDTLIARTLAPSLVCSFDDSLVEACAQRDLPHVSRRSQVSEWLAEHGCDYLFSIRNPWVLPDTVLTSVRTLAINFHDSLLPRYAGLHATSWALLHAEREHGISWHEITPGIDEGRLLTQVTVPIAPTDTALTLNSKCFDAAAIAFTDVVDALVSGTEVLTPQQGPRSYFSGSDRPAAQCLIDLDRPAREIIDLVRALDFGHAPNPLGAPKLWLDGRPLLVRRAEAASTSSPTPPGTLLSCSAGSLRVSTRTHDVVLHDLATLDGSPLGEPDMAERFSAWVDQPLPQLEAPQRAALTALNERVCQKERTWTRQLARGVNPAGHPHVPTTTWGTLGPASLPRLDAALAQVDPASRSARARGLIASYLARIHPEGGCDLGVVQPNLLGPARSLFMPIVPLRLPDAGDRSVDEFETEFEQRWARAARLHTFARDLGGRTPALRGRPVLPPRWPIAMMAGTQPPTPLDSEVALLLCIDPDGGPIRLWAAEGISKWQLDGIDAQLAALAHTAIRTPEHPAATLPLLDDAERERLLVTWNSNTRPLPSACIHELFEQQAHRTPTAPALRFADVQLSYAELDARANQVAHALRARDVREDDRVGLAIGRSIELVVGLLGILKAGATYVPIDCSLPRERIELIERRSQPSAIVTDQHSQAILGGRAASSLSFHDDASFIEAQSRSAPSIATDPQRIAYVIFTSGSTGEPKAVEVYHRGVVNHALAVQDHYAFSADDRMLCSASIGFDIAAEQLFPPLLHGAEVIVRPDDLLDSFRGFDQFIRQREITTVALPTAFWHEWVRYLSTHDLPVPPSLRVLGVGTEKVLGECLALWRQQEARNIRFIQGYGPTEATITCTMYVHDGHDVDPSRPLPIGRPVANTEIYLLDHIDAPVPVGMPGELCVGGLGLARGYLGRPDLTAERFVPHPFRAGGNMRIYKTGDIARYEPDGQLVFLGRSDSQVKVRGFRVELGEIEVVLRAHPSVEEAVVVLRDDPQQPTRLVAYIVADSALKIADLEASCRDRLPEYMVPADFVSLDSFPLTSNGKIDRTVLPAPLAAARPEVRDAIDPLEQGVAQHFADVLGLPKVTPLDGFFDLGGDSLRAMILLDRLEAEFATALPLTRFFQANTVEAVAQRIRAGNFHEHAEDKPAVLELKGGEGDPLYMILGVSMYEALTKELECKNPVYAVVQPVEAEMLRSGKTLPPVQELARMNVELLRRHQPEGPYILGGYSFGGFVAYEMAQLLLRDGAEVETLLLFDCMLPQGRKPGIGGAAKYIHRILTLNQGGALRTMLKKRVERAIRWRLGIDARVHGDEPQTESDQLRAYREGEYGRCVENYARVIRPYEGAVVLFRALGLRKPVMPYNGFEELVTGHLIAFDIPGDHDTILDSTNVPGMARCIEHVLSEPSKHTRSSRSWLPFSLRRH